MHICTGRRPGTRLDWVVKKAPSLLLDRVAWRFRQFGVLDRFRFRTDPVPFASLFCGSLCCNYWRLCNFVSQRTVFILYAQWSSVLQIQTTQFSTWSIWIVTMSHNNFLPFFSRAHSYSSLWRSLFKSTHPIIQSFSSKFKCLLRVFQRSSTNLNKLIQFRRYRFWIWYVKQGNDISSAKIMYYAHAKNELYSLK